MPSRSIAPLDADELRANQASVQDLVRRVEDYREQYKAGTFALVGPWGSGKSSLAIAAAAELKSNHGWKVATFEPWAYSDYPSMLYGFFRTLRKQLGEKKLNRRAEGTLQKFFQSVAPFENIGGVFGLPLNGVFSGLAKASAKREDFLTMRDEANKVFEQSDRSMLIIIEDIDRLHSAELMDCFKLIRLLGDLNNVYYLLCYDEHTVMDVMESSEIIGNGHSRRAREYLEKIVQVRVDVLELYGAEQEELWRVALDAFITRNSIELSTHEQRALSLMWRDILSIYMRTPRSLKRFALQLSNAWQAISGEVDFPDFVAINFLRTFEIELFHKLKGEKGDLLNPEHGYGRKAIDERIEKWKGIISDCQVREPAAVFELLSNLFPSIVGYHTNLDYLTHSRPRRISRDLYFDRYFRNLLAVEEIPERYYRAYIEDVALGEYCELSDRVRRSLNTREKHIWGRLEDEITGRDISEGALFRDIRSQYAQMMSVGGAVTAVDADLLRLAFRILQNDGRRYSDIEWYAELAKEAGGMALATDIFLDRWELDYPDSENSFTNLKRALMELAEERIIDELRKSPSSADHSVLRSVKILARTQDISDVKARLREIIGGSTMWTIPDFLASFLRVDITHTPEGPTYVTGAGGLDRETVERFFGVEWAMEKANTGNIASFPFLEWSENRPRQNILHDLVVAELHRLGQIETKK